MSESPQVSPAPVLSRRALRKKKETEVELGRQLITQFSILAAQQGCPDDQIFNFLKAGVILQAKQLRFAAYARACDLPDGPKDIMAGGGRGPLALDTPILTVSGWKTMGTMEVGDCLFDENGKKCFVLETSEIFYERECFELEFDNGERIVADADHPWHTVTKAEQKAIDRRSEIFRSKRRNERSSNHSKWLVGKNILPDPQNGSIKTTQEISDTIRIKGGREINHRIRIAKPLDLDSQPLPIHPYLLGLWLGDGSKDSGRITSNDPEIFDRLASAEIESYKMRQKYEWRIVGFTAKLRDLDLYENKHIPEQYFWGDFNQRIELVRGLMDSDGTCSKNGMASFCNTDKKIIDGMARLITTLGVKVAISTWIPKIYGKECSQAWKIYFKPTFNPFGLKRKSDRFICASRKTNFNHYIAACRKIESVPVRCISVSSPSNLFLAGQSLIPTHNSAKTHGILAQIFCDDCQRVPGLKVLVVRKVGRANKEQIQDFRKKLLSEIPHNYREQASTITFDNGSMVIMGNFKDEKDLDKYLGLEYDLIHIVESNQLTMTKKMNILSCLRTNKTNWRPRCYEDTNPGGINHVGNKLLFVEPYKAGRETETRYIHCTVDDNKFVDSGYKEYLEKLVGWQREAWLHGSWEFMAGAFFSNFHPDIHVYPNAVTDLNERSIVRWFGGLDYGYSHPTAFILFAEDEGGNVFAVAEYCQSNTIIEEHCANIRDLCSLKNIDVSDLEFIAAGKDCFRVDKDGSTVATEYQARGIMLTACHIDRINAWSQVAEMFGDIQHQIKPRFFVHKNCTDLITQIQSAQSDPKKPNDILKMNANPDDQTGGDDALESCRNGLVMAYSSVMKSAQPLQLGGFKPVSHGDDRFNSLIDVNEIIAESERLDLERRGAI